MIRGAIHCIFATAAVRSSTFELNFAIQGEYKTLIYAVYISAMRENFALNFTQLLNNKICILSPPSFVEILENDKIMLFQPFLSVSTCHAYRTGWK